MAAPDLFKGFEVTLKTGTTGQETTVAKATEVTYTVNQATEAFYQLGTRTPAAIKSGLQTVSGTFSHAVVDTEWMAKACGFTASEVPDTSVDKVYQGNGTAAELADSPADLQGAPVSASEISAGDYTNIQTDDTNYATQQSTTANDYAFFMLKFDDIGAEANIDFVEIEIVGYCDTGDLILKVYDDTAGDTWDTVGTIATSNSAPESKRFIIPNVADYIDTNNDMWFMVMQNTVNPGSQTDSVNLDYAILRINRTTENNPLQPGTSIKLVYSDGVNTDVNAVLAGCKFTTYETAITNDGSTVIENLSFTATGVTFS